MKLKLKSVSLIKLLAIVKQIVNKMITSTSSKTVTLMAIFVNRPFALNSFITAITEDGDFATNIVPVKIATAIFADMFICFIKGIKSSRKKTDIDIIKNVIIN